MGRGASSALGHLLSMEEVSQGEKFTYPGSGHWPGYLVRILEGKGLEYRDKALWSGGMWMGNMGAGTNCEEFCFTC